MKQAVYTICPPSPTHAGGFDVLDSSEPLSDRERATVAAVAVYELPPGMDPTIDPAAAPARLALLETPAGRLLCHSVYAGRDVSSGRWGNTVTHAVLDPQATLTAAGALDLRAAEGWRRHGAQTGPTRWLDLSAATPMDSVPTDDRRRLARRLLEALMGRDARERIVVAAPPELFAGALRLALRLVPPAMAEGLTFSTYERHPATVSVDLVACWPPDLARAARGTRIDANNPGEPTDSRFGYPAFALPEPDQPVPDLGAFVALAQSLGIDNGPTLEALYAVEQGDGLEAAPANVRATLAHTPLRDHWIDRDAASAARAIVVAAAAGDRRPHPESIWPLVARLLVDPSEIDLALELFASGVPEWTLLDAARHLADLDGDLDPSAIDRMLEPSHRFPVDPAALSGLWSLVDPPRWRGSTLLDRLVEQTVDAAFAGRHGAELYLRTVADVTEHPVAVSARRLLVNLREPSITPAQVDAIARGLEQVSPRAESVCGWLTASILRAACVWTDESAPVATIAHAIDVWGGHGEGRTALVRRLLAQRAPGSQSEAAWPRLWAAAVEALDAEADCDADEVLEVLAQELERWMLRARRRDYRSIAAETVYWPKRARRWWSLMSRHGRPGMARRVLARLRGTGACGPDAAGACGRSRQVGRGLSVWLRRRSTVRGYSR